MTNLTAAAAAALDTSTGIISFVSGNMAMNPMMLNFVASVRCLPRSFPVLAVPLDAAGRDQLEERGSAFTIYHDAAAEARFSASESLDGYVRRKTCAVG